MKMQPAVKWSGSKRTQAKEIVKYFPKKIDCYVEPFAGGATVLCEVLHSDIKCNAYFCSDLNEDLINLWKRIKSNPEKLIDTYRDKWTCLTSFEDVNSKRGYFEQVRDEYNQHRNPEDFLFLLRTCFNGMPRYNKRGEFNTSYHLTRNGIIPDSLEKILVEWSDMLNKHDVIFECRDYESILPSKNDFLYLDPPYARTKGMYFDMFDNERFFKWLQKQECSYALSYDGVSGDLDQTYNVPKNLYDNHIYLKSGKSSFKRLKDRLNTSYVFESLYLKNNL